MANVVLHGIHTAGADIGILLQIPSSVEERVGAGAFVFACQEMQQGIFVGILQVGRLLNIPIRIEQRMRRAILPGADSEVMRRGLGRFEFDVDVSVTIPFGIDEIADQIEIVIVGRGFCRLGLEQSLGLAQYSNFHDGQSLKEIFGFEVFYSAALLVRGRCASTMPIIAEILDAKQKTGIGHIECIMARYYLNVPQGLCFILRP